MSRNGKTIVRFSVKQRVEHLAIMILFTLLAITGFPQRWPEAGWSVWTAGLFGGSEALRAVHRYSGILFSLLTVIHLGSATWLVATKRARPSLVPTRQDFEDSVQTLRYYLGITDRHARFDRFDYRQKFEYWGLVLGGMLMIVTGFMLYFPIETTRFVPGEFIPVAKAAHGNEGLLAFLVVITWHIFNAHFSPEAFPFDKSIFTGRISIEKMKHEHPLEWERLHGGKTEAEPAEKLEGSAGEASTAPTARAGP